MMWRSHNCNKSDCTRMASDKSALEQPKLKTDCSQHNQHSYIPEIVLAFTNPCQGQGSPVSLASKVTVSTSNRISRSF